MLKKFGFLVLLALFSFSGQTSFSSEILATPMVNSDVSIIAKPVAFVGTVKFQQRFTRVEPTQCSEGPCQRSRPYWSIVFDSGQDTYLLDRRIENEGELNTVSVNGVTLKPGSRVKVAGQVVSGGPTFFILLSVHKIKILAEPESFDNGIQLGELSAN